MNDETKISITTKQLQEMSDGILVKNNKGIIFGQFSENVPNFTADPPVFEKKFRTLALSNKLIGEFTDTINFLSNRN